jgi:hypothetical protein
MSKHTLEQPQVNPTTTFIYALIDPRTDYVRYVGKANKPLTRLRLHLLPAELEKNTHKAHWLKELLYSGFNPIQIILEEVNRQEWAIAEKRWITYYRSIPDYPRLTNSTDGGEGTDGYTHSKETRQKLSTPKTWKTRLHLSVAQENRWRKASEDERKKMLDNLRTPWTDEKRKKRSLDARTALRKANATSRYLNVVKVNVRGNKTWRAACVFNGKFKFIGLFYTEEEAAKARDRFVLKHIGYSVPLNFPLAYYEHNPVDIIVERPNRIYSQRPNKRNTSGYKGVTRNGKNGWRAAIMCNGVYYLLGTHKTKEEAAKRYDIKAIELFGDSAKTNFPLADYQ